MKSAGRIIIPSVTLEKKDLQTLVDILLRAIESKSQEGIATKLCFQGKNFKEEYSLLELPEFEEFSDQLEAISLILELKDDFQISVFLSSQEINPFSPVFSHASIEANNSTFVAGILDELRRFFSKRRNLNIIFHSYGIVTAIALAYLLTYTTYFDLKNFGLIESAGQETLKLTAFLISYPLKAFLRWAFPYALFKGENRLRDYIKFILGTIFVGLLGRAAYTFLVSGIPPLS